jgi:hypothetical protein
MKKNTTINACLTQTGTAPKTTIEVIYSFNQKEKIMKNLRNFFVGLVGLLLILQLAFVSPVAAQSSRQAERQRLSRVMDANTNVEEFRQELLNYFTELEDAVRLYDAIPAVHEKYVKSGLRPLDLLAQTKVQIAEMSSEDLAKMKPVYARFPGWREAPRAAASLLEPELRENLQAKLAAKQDGSPSPDAVTPDDCALAIATDVSNSDVAIAKGFEIAARTAMNALPTDFLSFAPHAVAAAALGVLEAISLGLETSKNIKDDCTELNATDVQGIVNTAKTEIINNDNGNATTIVNNDNTNKDTILTNLNTKTATITTAITNSQNAVINNGDTNLATITTAITNAKTDIVNNDNSNRTTIVNNDNANATTLNTAVTNARNTIVNNDNTNTTNIVNNDNANKTAIINNATANTTTLNTAITNAKTEILNNANANATALQDALLRSQIEADLATESNGVKVAWYMTPTANGGKLDLVQSIVTLTLANIRAAGGSIGNAQSFLDRANADKAAGNFKSAYDNYCRAYKAAAN